MPFFFQDIFYFLVVSHRLLVAYRVRQQYGSNGGFEIMKDCKNAKRCSVKTFVPQTDCVRKTNSLFRIERIDVFAGFRKMQEKFPVSKTKSMF